MREVSADTLKYNGRGAQTGIYFKKFLRMFVYQSDWKVLPIGAIIAALVTLVVGGSMFQTQEGTATGTFALTCVCIWNGFFNSIQVVCRERDIIKREHRAGMHISSYVLAHMLYQLLLCVMQTVVTMLICAIAGVHFPEAGVITPSGVLDMGLTILLVTYAADIMALMVSCIVKTTTTAMTTMPFLLIFQLIFSGGIFDLGGADFIKAATISHWGTDAMCTIGRYNTQPMVTLWNTLVGYSDLTVLEHRPILEIIKVIDDNNMRQDFLMWSGQNNANPAYEAIAVNVWPSWGVLLLMILIFAVVAVIALKLVDRDKR